MKRVIYSKYSDERSRQYALTTCIFLEQGEKRVEKKAIWPEGKEHIHALPRYQKQLSELFADSPMTVQPAELTEDGDSCVFPYISGISLEDKLKTLHLQGLYEQVIREIKEYFGIIKKHCSDRLFETTEPFRQIFGEEDFPADTQCTTLNNIDYAFGNIILTENGMTLIDYEWCFDFPIPTDYILFRSLLYFVYSVPDNEELIRRGIFTELGYSDSKIEQYQRMEGRFQAYISGGTVSIASMKESMLQKTLHIHELYTGRDQKIVHLNGIIEQKENYIIEQRGMISERDNKIIEQRGMISERDNKILRLDGYINEVGDKLQSAAKDTKFDQPVLLEYLPGFLDQGVIRGLFNFYSRMRKKKNEDQ